ncbi:MAG: DNA-processing protein DprA [Paludibacteraceae bacterium]|nr:DNA-processing protein DprA [Paludibacteraceae bacterium]
MRDAEQLKYIIALPLLPEVGLRTAKALIEYFGSAKEVFSASKADMLSIPNIHKDTVDSIFSSKVTALQRAEKELGFIEKNNILTYYFEDTDYPYRLRECPDAPILLYGKGYLNLNDGKFLSVVGTRMPTDNGKQICKQIVLDLAQSTTDLTIVSGLAYGIDVTAHKAAISSGIPTLIIPGHGLDRIYPYANRQVAVESLKEGGILTEYMSETQPDRQNFVARNRIIAGLSDATLVVESKLKGGSLITADMANGYSREVFAIPGRPSDKTSAGCNMLIKQQKAALVESAEDILSAMQWDSKEKSVPVQTELFDNLTEEETLLLDMLHKAEDGLHVNLIVMETHLPYSQVTSTLMMMELKGIVRSLPGNIYKAAK